MFSFRSLLMPLLFASSVGTAHADAIHVPIYMLCTTPQTMQKFMEEEQYKVVIFGDSDIISAPSELTSGGFIVAVNPNMEHINVFVMNDGTTCLLSSGQRVISAE